MIFLHEETNPDETPKCVQWMVGDAHYTGRRMCWPNGDAFQVQTSEGWHTQIKVSYCGGEVLVKTDLLHPYQRPENIKKVKHEVL